MLCVSTVGMVIWMTKSKRSYSELITIPTFKERFQYLKLDGVIGRATFGFDRYLNQNLYHSQEWKRFRRDIIVRDKGLDLACEGFEICGKVLIHHINPIAIEDIVNNNPDIFDYENVVAVSHNTHNAIHYGDEELLVAEPIERSPFDTCPWKQV